MDLFLTEEDYLPAEFDELPLDEAILRVRELEDERPSSSKEKKSKEKRKRNKDDDDDDDGNRSDGGPDDDQYSDDDGWLVNDLGDDGYVDDDEEDEQVISVKDGVKVFGADEAEEEDDDGGGKKKKKKPDDEDKEKKPRRRVKPGIRVILNVDRLRDVRGLAALPDTQRKLRFKGKGHEEEDLSMIMETMEQWAHRLMPKMKFDDFIKKTEIIGRKRPIKMFVHNMRNNLPLNTIRNGKADIDFEQLARDSDEEFAFDDDLPPVAPINAEDAFDAMMREAEEVVKQRAAAATGISTASSPATSNLGPTTNQSIDKTVTPMKTSTQTLPNSQNFTPIAPKTPSTLTEEQRKRIAENARKAAEKRLSLSIARSQQAPNS